MKKKIITLCALISVAALTYAQPEKKDVYIGGNLSAVYSDNTLAGRRNDAQGGVFLDMLIGVVLDKGWVVGGGPRYRNYFDTDFDGNGNKVSRQITHSLGPSYFVRHYMRLNDKLYLRAGLTTGYFANMFRIRYFPSDTRTQITVSHSIDLRLRVGLAFFPHPNVGLEFSYGELGYQVDFAHVRDANLKSVSNHFGFKYGVDGIEVSISYFMRKNRKTEKGEKTEIR
jgi:hypothetical protein